MSTREYAVITGASSGIGAATARALADNGYHVIAAARRIDKLKELQQAMRILRLSNSMSQTR